MKKVRIICCIIIFCLLLPAAAYASFPWESGDTLIVTVKAGYGGKTGINKSVPVKVTVYAYEDFEGTVSVQLTDQLGENYAYERPLKLAKGKKRTLPFCVPILQNGGTKVLIRDDGDAVVYERELTNSGTDENLFYVGILSDEPNSLAYLDGHALYSGSSMQCDTFQLDRRNLPYDSEALDLFDMIIISRMETDRMGEGRKQALLDWVYDGGWLIFSTGEYAEETLSGFQELLGISVNQETEGSENQLAAADISMEKGDRIKADEDGRSIYQRRKMGRGWIGIVAYDMEALNDVPQLEESATNEMFMELIGEETLYRSIYSENQNSGLYYQLAGVPESNQFPSVVLYGGILVFYVLILLPGLYLLLRKKDKLHYFRLSAVASAILFTVLIYGASSGTRFSSPFCNYLMVREYDGEKQKDYIIASIQSPSNWRYETEIAQGVEVKPLLDVQLGSPSSRTSQTVLTENNGKTSISFQRMVAFFPRYFSLETEREHSGLSASLSVSANGLSGQLTNGLDCDLEQAAVVWYGGIVPIGYLAKGQTVDLSQYKCYSYQGGSPWEAASQLTEGNLSGSYRAGNSQTVEKRKTLLGNYLAERFGDYSEDACLVGFAAEAENGVGTLIDYETYGTVLSAASLDIDCRTAEGYYQEDLPDKPKAVAGGYYEDGTPYTESTVLDYQIRSYMKVRQLMLRDCSLNGEVSLGTLYFYNWRKGEFDEIPADKTSWTAEELEDYLQSNTLRVKWITQRESRIPSFSMIWEE